MRVVPVDRSLSSRRDLVKSDDWRRSTLSVATGRHLRRGKGDSFHG